MRRLRSIIFFLLGGTLLSQAATLSDVKIIEASQNIQYLTQNIAKNYLYLYTYPHKQHLKAIIQDAINELENNIRTIAITTKAEKTKELLDFFAYEKEQVKLLLKGKPEATKTDEFLDFSETLSEGAENIVNSVAYNYSFEDKMFIRTKRIEYLMEKLAKYYMTKYLDIDNETIGEDTTKTIKDVEKNLAAIQQYVYPKALNTQKEVISKLWNASKDYYSISDTTRIPTLVLLTAKGLQNIMAKIAIHHGKGE